jgi:hypothetical protein
MGLSPTGWSVVIVGRWNRAILTPAGIAKRVFKLAANEVMVLVQLDGISPHLVRHPEHGIIAMTDEGRLQLHVDDATYETLAHAMQCGVNALSSLPETPVSAAGFNVNFESPELTPHMAGLLAGEMDKSFADLGYRIAGRTVSRSAELAEGRLNITLTGENGTFKVLANFHRSSTECGDLKSWLQMPIGNVKTIIENVVQALGLDMKELSDESNRQ